jgi:hypothetical protein
MLSTTPVGLALVTTGASDAQSTSLHLQSELQQYPQHGLCSIHEVKDHELAVVVVLYPPTGTAATVCNARIHRSREPA